MLPTGSPNQHRSPQLWSLTLPYWSVSAQRATSPNRARSLKEMLRLRSRGSHPLTPPATPKIGRR